MNILRRTLLAIGEPKLQELVGKATVRLLSLLDESSVSATNLADLLQRRYGDAILLEPTVRKEIILALDRKNVDALCLKMLGHTTEDPWQTLYSLSFDHDSVEIEKLYEHFGIDLPPQEWVSEAPPSLLTVSPEYPLYPYQHEIVGRALERLNGPDRRVLIHMPTGSGKTRCAISLVSRFLRSIDNDCVVVWLAHSEELCDQAAEEFEKCWMKHGDRTVRLGRFYGVHEIDLAAFKGGVIVAGLSKLHARSLSQQSDFLRLKRQVRLVILDEAHKATAPTYQHVLEMLAPEGGWVAILGLTATPGRSWLDMGEDQALADFFARQKVAMEVPHYSNPIVFLQEEGYLAVPEYKPIPYSPSISLSDRERRRLAEGFDLSLETVRSLGDDQQRNLLLMREILQATEDKSKILVFACSVEHAYVLAGAVVVKGIRAAAISAATERETRRQIIESFRKPDLDAVQVVVNYGVLTTGFDAPRTNVVVVARPTQSVVLYSQMIGRAMRGPKAGGNEQCRVITVVDALPGFRNVYEGFLHWEDVW
jgi:DNA repair protein RadD